MVRELPQFNYPFPNGRKALFIPLELIFMHMCTDLVQMVRIAHRWHFYSRVALMLYALLHHFLSMRHASCNDIHVYHRNMVCAAEFRQCTRIHSVQSKNLHSRIRKIHWADWNWSIDWTMNKIIFILFVFMATYSCEELFKHLDCLYPGKFCSCLTTYMNGYRDFVCGTDDRTYQSPWRVRCERDKEYGKRVNLHIKYWGPCINYGFEYAIVSEFELVWFR